MTPINIDPYVLLMIPAAFLTPWAIWAAIQQWKADHPPRTHLKHPAE